MAKVKTIWFHFGVRCTTAQLKSCPSENNLTNDSTAWHHWYVEGHKLCCRVESWKETKCSELNTSCLTDSYISFTLKLESRQNFCFNSLIRSSTYGKKNISDFPPCGKMVVFVTEFVIFLKTRK